MTIFYNYKAWIENQYAIDVHANKQLVNGQ